MIEETDLKTNHHLRAPTPTPNLQNMIDVDEFCDKYKRTAGQKKQVVLALQSGLPLVHITKFYQKSLINLTNILQKNFFGPSIR